MSPVVSFRRSAESFVIAATTWAPPTSMTTSAMTAPRVTEETVASI